MSTLQISLAVVGVILLGLIIAYNTWTHRRNVPKRPAPKRAETGDSSNAAAEQPPRFDPALDGVDSASSAMPAHDIQLDDPLLAASPVQENQPDTAAAIDPVLDAAPAGEPPPVDPVAAQTPPPPAAATAPKAQSHATAPELQQADRRLALDSLIDAIAPLRLDRAVTGETVLQVQPTTRRAGSKPFRIEGLNTSTGEWESVRAGQHYRQLQAGVQLANRLGALNEIEFSEFIAKVQTFADGLGAAVDLPDMLHEVNRARELDQFAGAHDAQLTFVLRPRRAAWSPGYIEQHVATHGFIATPMPGRMVLPSAIPGHAPLLSLSYDAQAAQADNLDQTAVHQFALSLDVPQVPRTEAPFTRLRQVVQALCESMDGMLCDQNGQQLLPQVFDPIGADLQGLYDRLDSHDLPAGSVQARRLFS